MNKQSILKSTLCLLMALLCNVAWAQSQTQATQPLSLTADEFQKADGKSTWTYHGTTNSGGWYGKFVTGTIPALTAESTDMEANNIGWSNNRPWIKAGYTYNLTLPEGYLFDSYKLTTQSTSSGYTNTFTYTTAEGTATSENQTVGSNKTITVTGLSTQTITLAPNGDATASNYGILIVELAITYKKEDDNGVYALEIKGGTGEFTDGSKVWSMYGNIGLTFASNANNMNVNGGYLQIHPGKAGNATYTIAVPAPYVITGYSFDYAFGNSGTATDKVLAVNGQEYTVEATAKTLTVSDLNNVQSTQFTLAGSNQPVKLTNFVVNVVTPVYTLTDAVGNVYKGTYLGTIGVDEPTFEGAEYTLTDKVWNGNQFTANIEFTGLPFPVSSEEVTNATMIANWGNSNNDSEKKWHAVLENGVYNLKVQTKDPDITELNTWKWAIYPQLSNGVFTFKIKNMHTGTYVYANPENTANAQGSKGYIVLKEEGTAFTIVKNGDFINLAYVGKNSTTLKLTTNGSGDTDVYLGSYAGTHAGNHINWPDLTVYSATIPTSGYSAIYTPIAVTIPDGVKVYAGKVDGNWVVPSEVSGTVIPANTAVILKGTAAGTYTFNKTDDAPEAIADNDLKGSSERVTLTEEQGYTMPADAAAFKMQLGDIAPYTAYITRPLGSAKELGMFIEGYILGSHEGFVNEGVYTFVTARGWMGAKNDNNNVISTAKTSHGLTGSDADPMFQWSVYKSKNGYYYLYNLGNKQFMGVQSSNNASIPFAATPNNRKLTFKKSSSSTHPIMFSTDNAGVANHSADHGDGLITWTGGWNNLNDGGSNHQVTLVDKLTEANLSTIAEVVEAYEAELKSQAIEALGTAITTAQPKRNGMGGELGYYSSTDVNATTTFDAIVEFKNSITDETTINTIEGHTKTVNELFTLNVPQPGKFYRLKGISGNYIDATSIYNNANATSGQMSMKAEANANLAGTIFYLDEEKHFLNYATGTYVNQTREIGAVGNANKGVWSFNASPRTLGTLALSCTTTGNAGQNLHDNGGTRADRCDRNCGDRHDWTVEEVTTLPVTISAAKVTFNEKQKYVSTLFAPVALEVPVGITAYIGVNEDNYLAMDSIAGVGGAAAIIPAGTGVILMADSAKTYNFTISAETGTAILPGANIITGTVAKTIITPGDAMCYVLANPKDEVTGEPKGVGLYKAELNKNENGAAGNTSFLNNAFKAYVPVEGAQGDKAPALVMRLGRGQGTTEIELPTAKGQQPTAVYDLQGRRVLNPTKGIYIVNGKKVLF